MGNYYFVSKSKDGASEAGKPEGDHSSKSVGQGSEKNKRYARTSSKIGGVSNHTSGISND
jgi:hypothetical protein